MSNQAKVEQLAAELRNLGGYIPVALTPADAFAMAGCLQLAWRHPRLSSSQKAMIERFVRQIQGYLREAGAVATVDVIELGWNPDHDSAGP